MSQQRIEELKSILNDIESHIVESSGYYIISTDIEGGEWGITVDEDWNDDDELATVYVASDAMTSEKCESLDAAKAWLVEAIDTALSCELAELEYQAKTIDGIEDVEIQITSFNPQDSGWSIVTDEIKGDGIYAQTERANLKTVTVKTAHEVYNIDAALCAEAASIEQARAEIAAFVMTPAQIEKEFNLASGTVRQAIHQRRFSLYSRPDERTILIRRADAVARWGKSDN